MTPRQGRGRPVEFDDGLRDRYLAAVAGGMGFDEAARHCWVSVNVPRRLKRADPAFAAAVTQAKVLGKKVRADRVPHGEARYTNYGCRCQVCTAAATTARAARRQREAGDAGGQVVELPALGELSPSFSLARAS